MYSRLQPYVLPAATLCALGTSAAALESAVLSHRFTIAALCLTPLVLVEGELVASARLLSFLRAVCWLLLSLVLGPLPTLCRFIALPLTQTGAFVRTELLPFLFGPVPPEEDTEGVGSEEGEEGDGAAGGDEELRSQSRLAASATVQFELLLAATKSLVPLLALVCTG